MGTLSVYSADVVQIYPLPLKPAGTQHNNALHSCQMFSALYLTVRNIAHSHHCVNLWAVAACELLSG